MRLFINEFLVATPDYGVYESSTKHFNEVSDEGKCKYISHLWIDSESKPNFRIRVEETKDMEGTIIHFNPWVYLHVYEIIGMQYAIMNHQTDMPTDMPSEYPLGVIFHLVDPSESPGNPTLKTYQQIEVDYCAVIPPHLSVWNIVAVNLARSKVPIDLDVRQFLSNMIAPISEHTKETWSKLQNNWDAEISGVDYV